MKEPNQNKSRILYTAIKILVLLLGAFWFWHNWDSKFLVFNEPNSILFHNLDLLYLIPSIVLFFVNWLIESFKWQLLIQRTEVISLRRSFFSVFAGTTASALIPYKMGSYLGRMLFLETSFKARAIPATILGNLMQSSITFFIGIFGFFYLIDTNENTQTIYIIAGIILFVFLVTLPLYYKKLAKYVNSLYNKLIQKKKLKLISLYENNTLFKVWLYSLLRYMAFTLHFALLIKAFGIEVPLWDIAIAITVVYFLQSFSPSFILIDFGVKASIAIGILSMLPLDESRLNYILIIHYLLNSVLPVILGGLSILFIQIKNK